MPVHRPGTDPVGKDELKVKSNWQRLVMDITHYSTRHFLMLTDCGPLRLSIKKKLIPRVLFFLLLRRHTIHSSSLLSKTYSLDCNEARSSRIIKLVSRLFSYGHFY